MLRPICIHKHIAGTLTANETFDLIFPFDVQLIEVQAKASNDSDATIKLGTTSDDDAYIESSTIGDSGSWGKFDRDDFVNDQFPHITKQTTIRLTLDYDGAAGTAAADFEIMYTFTEG